MRTSVIIPVLNEEKSIAATLLELQRLKPDEVIIVDGGSSDRTREVCQRFGVELYPSCRGRARQMNFGAQRGTGDVLLFLHADTRLPLSAFNDIRAALQYQKVLGGRFDLQLDDPRPMLKLIGFMISLR
ncbi:MAG: glycosyltransferase, partial [Gammaproteobacteria bacterium]